MHPTQRRKRFQAVQKEEKKKRSGKKHKDYRFVRALKRVKLICYYVSQKRKGALAFVL